MYFNREKYVFEAGDFRFLRRNQLTKYSKIPPLGGEYKSISIFMDQKTLRSISEENNLTMDKPYSGENALVLKPING
ncbi:hypothetical protein Dfri01_29560 [Dyadobacter frigoris]|uniref:Uncharacterized protein n=2 Tax=Dyadobacter frigoris TaxID=2576211 RepID=A0A4U6D4R7_9BACT|nr:hypothetical protein [Dyadobacter frigoris]TKT92310.1 hypothetical protein FDK13_10045 [Dyadobacter frigoris]GLU53495.1 hypothetical protein Dfri01_29560 [Dyadobacter frigoris]